MATESPRSVEKNDHVNREDDDCVSPLIGRSLEAYRRDLPDLLKAHPGKWVAHHGEKQIGIARTAGALYQKFFRRGLKDDEFLVSHISPAIPDDEITWSGEF